MVKELQALATKYDNNDIDWETFKQQALLLLVKSDQEDCDKLTSFLLEGEESDEGTHVIIDGNLKDGFTAHGPFHDEDEAQSFADEHLSDPNIMEMSK